MVLQAVLSPLLPSICAYQDPQAQMPRKGDKEATREPAFTHKACWEAEGGITWPINTDLLEVTEEKETMGQHLELTQTSAHHCGNSLAGNG